MRYAVDTEERGTDLRPNPGETQGLVDILIDRDLTLASGPRDLVATFASPVQLFRAIDGDELSIVHDLGRFEGGMFANVSERRWGASWAGSSVEQVAEWARGWAKRGRIGKTLFVAVADADGHIFFREGGREAVEFDPEGPAIQPAAMDSAECNTGLGCSVVVSTEDVTFFRVSKTGTTKKMTQRDVDGYVAKHPVPDVLLRNFGFGTPWFSGLVLGQPIIVGQDDVDKLWNVEDREGEPVVIGAKTKAAAVRETQRLIEDREWARRPVRLNRVPDGFEQIEVGDRWAGRRGFQGDWTGTAVRVGASYVYLRGAVAGDIVVVKAPELMSKWRAVEGRQAVLKPNPPPPRRDRWQHKYARPEQLPPQLPEWASPDERQVEGLRERLEEEEAPRDWLDCMSDAEVEKMLFGFSSLKGFIELEPDEIEWDPSVEGPYGEVLAEVEEAGPDHYDTSTPIIVDLLWDGTFKLNDGHHRYIVNQEFEHGGTMTAEVQIPPGLARAWARRLRSSGLVPNATVPMGECFPFATKLAARYHGEPDTWIAHGRVTNKFSGESYLHAWVERGDRVFDWQTTRPDGIDRDVFYEIFQPSDVTFYTPAETVRNCVREGHHGPWTE